MAFPNATSQPLHFEAQKRLREAPSLELVNDQSSSLRKMATEADLRATQTQSLAVFWQELAGGQFRVVDCYFSEHRCYVVTEATGGEAQPVARSAIRVLEAVLTHGAQKVVAIDLEMTPSTVASKTRVALQAMGVGCTAMRIHPLLVLAALEGGRMDPSVCGSLSFVAHLGRRLRVVSVARADRRLAESLPRAEFHVARLLFEGVSQARIAHTRGTSQRTVANQLASVFRRLKVSGRGEFLLFLLAQRSSK